ncbi:MAG: SGNH/GDSL hydrolase family protein [Pseudomonadales bacterium]|jgi:outer membrane lipase/esterase
MFYSINILRPIALVLAAVLCMPVLAIGDTPGYARAQHLVVFGDSLSDTGNKYAVRGLVNDPPYDGLNEFGVPSDPYSTEDGIYFSNGSVWIEKVAAVLGDFGASRPALGDWPLAGNYAWGGAHANPPPFDDGNRHLEAQVTAYLDDVGYDVRPDTLHVIFIGGNDVVAALLMLSGGTPFPDVLAHLGFTVGAVDQALQRLTDAGARRFLVLNVPDVGLIPAVAHPGGKALLSCFSELVDFGRTSRCPGVGVSLELPDSLAGVAERRAGEGLEVTTVDTYAFIRALADSPESLGYSNVADKCVTPLVAPYACPNPNAYLFWDGLHPTEATHRLLAALVLNRLGY